MSDSLVLINTFLTRGEVDIPRYADIFEDKAPQSAPVTLEDHMQAHGFDKLMRKGDNA